VTPWRTTEQTTQAIAVQTTSTSFSDPSVPTETAKATVERADPAHAEPREEEPLLAGTAGAGEREQHRERAHHEQEQRDEQPAGDAGLAEPRERERAPDEQDDRELGELLRHLGAVVDADVQLVVALVAPEREPARERGEEAVPVDDLGHPVDGEHGWDREPAVVLGREEVVPPRAHGHRGESVPARGADRDAGGDRVEHVRERPLDEPAVVCVRGREEPEDDEREREAVVQPRLGGDREVRLPLVLLAGRPDAHVAREHGVGRGERGAEHDGRRPREAHRGRAEHGDGDDRQRHHQAEQARDGRPARPRQVAVELQPGREERQDHGELGQALDDGGVVDRVDPVEVEQADGDRGRDSEGEVDERRRERAILLV
jgi:hypothetical protein